MGLTLVPLLHILGKTVGRWADRGLFLRFPVDLRDSKSWTKRTDIESPKNRRQLSQPPELDDISPFSPRAPRSVVFSTTVFGPRRKLTMDKIVRISAG